MCDCDCITPDAFWQRLRKARKEHVCCECRREIVIGETYVCVSGIWDGYPETHKICQPCEALRQSEQTINHVCICYCGLRDYTFDLHIEFPPEKLAP